MSPSATHPEEDYHDDYEDNLDVDECFPLMIIQLNLMMMTHLAPHLPGQGVDRLQGDGLEEERLTQSVARQPRVRDLVEKNI